VVLKLATIRGYVLGETKSALPCQFLLSRKTAQVYRAAVGLKDVTLYWQHKSYSIELRSIKFGQEKNRWF